MATFQLSPGVNISEFDLTAIIPAVASSGGAIAGVFNWGPIGERVLVDSEATLVTKMGKPSGNNYETWFTAASFLAYGSTLYVSRAGNTTSTDANVGVRTAVGNTGSANVIAATTKNDVDYLNKVGSYAANVLYIAKYPGAPGNSLRVSIADSANAYTSNVTFATSNATGTFSIVAGANTGRITVVPTANGVLADSFAVATAAAANIAVGDLISVGNSAIGAAYVKVASVSAAVNSGANSVVTLGFEGTYRLATDWSANTITRFWEFHNVTGIAPGTSPYVSSYGNAAAADELHAVVIDEGGYFSGVPGTILEVFTGLSRATDAKNIDNTPNYYKTVLNTSRYIRWANDRSGAASNTALNVVSSTNGSVLNLQFSGGTDGASEANVSVGDLSRAYDLFVNQEEVDIALVMAGKSVGGVSGELIGNYIIDNIAESRKDCVAFISPTLTTVVNNYGNEVASLVAFRALLRSTSYGFLDSGYKQMYDKYNNVFRWVPLNGDMAGLCARTDETNDPWWAPAGYNRGRLKNVVRLAFNPNKAARDILFPNNINPVVSFQNDGVLLYGDKTLQSKASAFDAINVRRLFIVLEKAIAKASKYMLWEFNDDYTRAQFRNMVNPYLRTVQGRRGILSFLVKADGKNNSSDVINRAGFVGDIYIKPSRAIRNIQLNFVATPEGVTFSEIELPQ